MMKPRLRIKKGDTVYVISGSYKGSKGRVLTVLPEERRVIVEGVNMVSKHTKPNAQQTQGGIIKREAPIHVSNVMLLDPETNRPTRVGKRRNDEGKFVRYAKKSGKEIK